MERQPSQHVPYLQPSPPPTLAYSSQTTQVPQFVGNIAPNNSSNGTAIGETHSPQPSVFESDFCIRQIEQWQAENWRRRGPNPQIDYPLRLLHGACLPGLRNHFIRDPLYVILHKILCLNHADIAVIPASLRNLPYFHTTCEHLNGIFFPMGIPPSYFLKAFSDFPTLDSPAGCRSLDIFSGLPSRVHSVLLAFARNWESLINTCLTRCLPPTAAEIGANLTYFSGTLQWLVSQSVFKRLVAPSNLPSTVELFATAFQQSQFEYSQREDFIAQGLPVPPATPPQIVYQAISAHLIPNSPNSGINPVFANGTRPFASNSTLSAVPAAHSSAMFAPRETEFTIPGHVTQGTFSTQALQSTGIFPTQNDTGQTVAKKILIPPQGQLAPLLANADPSTYVLHQARLLSPVPKLSERFQPSLGGKQRRYQYASHIFFNTSHNPISTHTRVEKYSFQLSKDDYDSIPQTTFDSDDTKTRFITDKSLNLRLRCVKINTDIRSQNDLVLMETFWPQHVYFSLNDHDLEPRQKHFYGKDLPIDLNDFVQVGDQNLKVVSNMRKDDQRPEKYILVIEALKTMNYEDVHRLCYEQRCTINDAKASLMRISAIAAEDDITISSTKVTLVDPIQGTIIPSFPVRGPNCMHQSCFDLDIFLQTREPVSTRSPGSKSVDNSDEDYISKVDVWKCPICNGDARPNFLRFDEYMDAVRRELEDRGQLDTVKAILINLEDASWKAADGPVQSNCDTQSKHGTRFEICED